MMKTKLGLSSELLAAIFYFFMLMVAVGSMSTVFVYAAVILGAYALYKEEDVWLKASIVKGALVVILVSVISACLGYVDNILEFINFFLKMADVAPISDGFGIVSWIMLIIRMIQKLVLILLAFFALGRKTIKLPVIDGIIAKHIQ